VHAVFQFGSLAVIARSRKPMGGDTYGKREQPHQKGSQEAEEE
jgi:hypothetical protein